MLKTRMASSPWRPARWVALGLAGLAALLVAEKAGAQSSFQTADVLFEMHAMDRNAIRLGKIAQKKAKSKDVANFGKMLVKDHAVIDKRVVDLAKREHIELAAPEPTALPDEMASVAKGRAFDKYFAQAILEESTKAIADLTEAGESTTDEDLKQLITAVLPTLEKHKATAERILERNK